VEVASLKERLAAVDAADTVGSAKIADAAGAVPAVKNPAGSTPVLYRHGSEKRAARTRIVMHALRALWDQAVTADDSTPADHQSSPSHPAGIALAAVGSLSRGQFGPHSDLDLVLIYDDRVVSTAAVTALAAKLWYPLWDAGLSLDYSVRSIKQCEAVTDADIPAAIGWLSVTAIAGDTAVVDRTAAAIVARWRKAARKRIDELETSASSRADEFGSLPYASQPHLKEARGGLRDANLVLALAASWLADRPHGDFDQAVERLLDVRDCLQLASAKESDVLLAQYQPRVAALLGLSDPTLEPESRDREAAADLQALIARLGRRIAYSLDSTLSRAEHSLIHERHATRFAVMARMARIPGMSRARGAHMGERPRLEPITEGVSVYEGQAVLDTRADVVNDRALPLRVAAAAAERGMHIAPITVSSLAACPVDDVTWSEQSRELFVRLLQAGPALLPVWEELDMARVPSRLIPEWDAVRNRPALSSVHRFTVDRHMVEVASRLPKRSPLGDAYTPSQLSVLFLAGIFHDIGKRRGIADHSAEGARQATAILYRMGYPVEVIAQASLLIREHLTLADFAQRRDPTDHSAWAELSDRLGGNPILLDMLFDITRADASSLGATSGELASKKLGWSSWRERLVTQMYRATRSWMAR
jgi:[protein-PII] uridylyltransferase